MGGGDRGGGGVCLGMAASKNQRAGCAFCIVNYSLNLLKHLLYFFFHKTSMMNEKHIKSVAIS